MCPTEELGWVAKLRWHIPSVLLKHKWVLQSVNRTSYSARIRLHVSAEKLGLMMANHFQPKYVVLLVLNITFCCLMATFIF